MPTLTLIDALGDDGQEVVLALLTSVPWKNSDDGKHVQDRSAMVGIWGPISSEFEKETLDPEFEVLRLKKGKNPQGWPYEDRALCRSKDWGPCLGDNEGIMVWDDYQGGGASYCKLSSTESSFESGPATAMGSLKEARFHLMNMGENEWYFTARTVETWAIDLH
jgi:hypothetical protein